MLQILVLFYTSFSFSAAAQLYIGNLTAYSNLSSLRVDAHHSLMVDAKLAMFDTLPRKD